MEEKKIIGVALTPEEIDAICAARCEPKAATAIAQAVRVVVAQAAVDRIRAKEQAQ